MRLCSPFVSKKINQLESNLQTTLFIRSTRSVQLTENGFILLDRAKLILKESREIKEFGTSKEEILRGKDNKFNSCLYLEFCNDNDAIVSMKNAEKNFKNAEIGAYKLISYLF